MISVKYIGNTPGFEDYYGVIMIDGKIITLYYYDARRYTKLYTTRRLFDGKPIRARSVEQLAVKVGRSYGLCKMV